MKLKNIFIAAVNVIIENVHFHTKRIRVGALEIQDWRQARNIFMFKNKSPTRRKYMDWILLSCEFSLSMFCKIFQQQRDSRIGYEANLLLQAEIFTIIYNFR